MTVCGRERWLCIKAECMQCSLNIPFDLRFTVCLKDETHSVKVYTSGCHVSLTLGRKMKNQYKHEAGLNAIIIHFL